MSRFPIGCKPIRFSISQPAIIVAIAVVHFAVAVNCLGQDRIDFSSQIKPILADKCFACHGPDEAQRTTDFRLDQKESALDPDASVIVPGDADESLLAHRILSSDPDEVMPPSDYLKSLTATQKQLLVDWINQGANWSEHWAFQKLKTSELPEIDDQQRPVNFIDHYILSKLESKNLTSSPDADPRTLLRRLSFDLTGLPPSYTDVRGFLTAIEKSGIETAYQDQVDRLLASPHFGERMAVYWLDLVRYADTVGYHGDQDVSVSPYRDYVIDAFNSNLPFDQFTREQLAGDLLPDPTQAQQIASGYNRLGMMSAEGGVQPEEYLNKYASDRVRTTSSVWLGVTLGCAECHDHKFDPFSAKEFYEFSAFFADIKEQGLYAGSNQSGKWGESIDIADPELPELLEPIENEIAQIRIGMNEDPELLNDQAEWEKQISARKAHWEPLDPTTVVTQPSVTVSTKDDYSVLISGENPKQVTYALVVTVDSRTKAIRLEALPHDSLPQKGPGRAGNGNFVVTELFVMRGDQSENLEALSQSVAEWPEELTADLVSLTSATATVEQTYGGEGHPDKKWSAASTIDHDAHGETWGWAILPDAGKHNELVVQIADDEQLTDSMTILVCQNHHNGPHTLGHFRLSQTRFPNASADPTRTLPNNIQTAIGLMPKERSEAQLQEITDYFRSITPRFETQRKQIAELEKRRTEIAALHTRSTLVTVSVPPREIRVLARGNWMDKSGAVVAPSVPRVLGGPNWDLEALKDQRPTRLELANWIADKSNPLTSRVFVNRMWRMFFGAGISNVLDDLGSQGEPPTHPELLDALAVTFVDSNWNVKQLVREIVTSRTYRQSSAYRTDLKEIDPENRLLARQSRFRLDAEFIRDHALFVSELLVDKTGGRSVMPYQPAGLYRHLNFPTREYQPSKDEDQYRRGLYTHWQRQFLHPAMKTFDAPSREECTAARPRSSTPLAALVLLNDPSYVEAARSLANLVLKSESSDEGRVRLIFQRAFSRDPSTEESEVIIELLRLHFDFFNEHEAEAKSLVMIGLPPKDDLEAPANVAQQAAWTSVCRAIINMHEFVSRK